MENVIIILIILAVVCLASWYIVKAKKKGQCIGCPYSKQCGGKCGGKH